MTSLDVAVLRVHISQVTANSVIGLGNPVSYGAQRRVSGFFVPVLWRAVRGRASALPGPIAPVYQPAHGSPPSRLVTMVVSSRNAMEIHHEYCSNHSVQL